MFGDGDSSLDELRLSGLCVLLWSGLEKGYGLWWSGEDLASYGGSGLKGYAGYAVLHHSPQVERNSSSNSKGLLHWTVPLHNNKERDA